MFSKGRGNRTTQPKGSKHPRSVLTEESVRKMREMYASGRFTMVELGEEFHTSYTNVSWVINRKTWKHVI